MVILYLEHANLGDRSETSVAGLGCLIGWLIVSSFFEFYHGPSGLFLQSRKLSEVYAFDRLPSKRWVPLAIFFQSSNSIQSVTNYECWPNSLV